MSSKLQMTTVSGLATARGLAAGPVFLYRGGGDIPIPEYTVEPERVEVELSRLRSARTEVRRDLENLISVLRERTGRSDVMVFECHLMFLDDPSIAGDAVAAVRESHLNAEAAVKKTAAAARAKFERMNDAYFRERVRDFDDLERRFLTVLTGRTHQAYLELRRPSIVIADDLTPSETVMLPRENVLGFATNGGSSTSHVALLARAMGIPAVTGLGDVTSLVKPGMTVLLDGSTGAITINPDERTQEDFNDLVRRQRAVERAGDATPAGTLADGPGILVYANMHPGVPTEGVKELGARGVGLYRSEYLWLNRELEPTEEEQFQAYREAAEFAMSLSPEATLTIRALDIGGDKTVRGISTREPNPFLGNRSIRFLLSHREVMLTQLRAILRASVYGRVALMFPMVSCVEEIREARTAVEEVKRQLDAEGVAYNRDILVGIMIEVPAAAINARQLAKYVDFFSIGTNDLVQYTMAADRGNEAVANLYQPTNPAVLELVRRTVDAAKEAGIHVAVCGESAADPVYGVLWASMGIEMLSMSASYIPVIAQILAQLRRADLDEYAALAWKLAQDGATAAEILAACRDWMRGKISNFDDLLV